MDMWWERKHQGEELSPYLIQGVYSYIWRAMEQGLNKIRLGSADVMVEENANALDDFSEIGASLAPYYLKAIRVDEVLRDNLHITQKDSILVIEIQSD